MLQALFAAGAAVAMAVLAPFVLLDMQSTAMPIDLVLIVEEQGDRSREDERSILLDTKAGAQAISLEEYLVGVVFSEMPSSFHEEALKSQAVAARTFALHRLETQKHQGHDICSDHACCQAWMSEETAREKHGENYLQHWQNAEKAVRDTRGEILTFDGDIVEAVYFSCSGGSTEDAVAVWGSDVPYLRAVVSEGEEKAPVFQTEKRVSFDVFKNELYEEGLVLKGDPGAWVSAVEHTDGGGVARICVGGQWLSGTQIRNTFGLNSSKFSVQVEGDDIVFQVFGYGHRVGMSQYGANAMANAGADYLTILRHYYTDITVEHMENRSSP